MKIFMVFPPQWTPAMPHLSLPVLTAYLRQHGVQVIQRDLNIETYDTILSRAYLEQAIEQLRAGVKSRRWGDLPERTRWALGQGAGLAGQVDRAKTIYRSSAFYDGAASLDAFSVIIQSRELASLPFAPARLDLLNYVPALPVNSSHSLIRAVRDPHHNMFLDLFRRLVLQDIEHEQPDIVGISIATISQILPGMTLAHLVKQSGLRCHITVGGPHITMLRDQLPRVPAFFSLVDSAIVFDGELPLLRLTEAIASNGDLTKVPNFIYKKGDQICINGSDDIQQPATRAASMTPDFDGLPLARYLVPELVLPLMTAHGCYHGQCGFCNVGYGGGKAFYPLPVDQLLDQITTLEEKYGVRHIFFADEAIPPHTLRELSTKLAERGSLIDWCGCARFERTLSRDLLETVARGGGRMLLFGLETASERMIEHMVKGTRRETMSRILKESTQATIWNHTFFFFGFPTEAIEDAQVTVNFIYEHQASIHSAAPGVFMLERYSPAHLNPGGFGIRRLIEEPDRDLAINFNYEPESGMDANMAQTLMERLLDVLPAKRYGQYYVHDVYRFLYASYLHAQNQPFPLWLAD
jgi:anaerobic magnesium-protoporphyrin IX monomethyl ester cyclase